MRRSGFTILELIAVIGIMAVIATAVVGGFSGMMKGVAHRNASDSVRRALNLARQEACVDGNDAYFYPVDVNSYAIVRRAGVVTSSNTGTRDVQYGDKLKIKSVSLGSGGKWIVDEFADLSDSTESFVVDETMDNADLLETFKDYAGSMVFDMDDGVYADVAYPPYRDKNIDAWVFGVKNAGSSFNANDEYGWVTHPIQSLPQGYVFKGTYNASTGEYKPRHGIYVHFNADGSHDPSSQSSITLERPENGETIVIKITAAGGISEE